MVKSQGQRIEFRSTSHTATRLLVRLGCSPSLSTTELAAPLPCSYATARRRLLQLHEIGLLEREQKGRAHEWRLAQPVINHSTEESVEIDFVTLVTEVINELADQLAAQADCNLSDAVLEWIDDRGLPEEVDRGRYVYRIIIYRRFLQSLLYRLYKPEFEGKLPELKAGAEWKETFAEADKLTENAGFELSPVDEQISCTPEWIDRVLLSLQSAAQGVTAPATTFAAIYETLTTQSARRELGQFATPDFIGQFLASWAVRNANDSILDPGIGAGQLATQALEEKLELGASSPLADITGVDVDQTAIVMAAVALKLTDGGGSSQLVVRDFLEYSSRSLSEEGHEVTQVDGVIANPPYSRHQAVDEAQKTRFKQIIHAEHSHELSPRTPLYGYFLAHAATLLKPGGRLAAIVPSKFLDTDFGRDLKRFLLSEFHIHGLIQLSDDIDIFDGIRIQPTLLLLERDQEADEKVTRLMRLDEWPSGVTPDILLDDDFVDDSAVNETTELAQHLLSPTERWTHYLEEDDLLNLEAMTQFGDIANISRGIATGDNDYFCLTQSEIDEYGIPDAYLQPIIRSAHGMRTIDLQRSDWEAWRDDDLPVQLLYCYDTDDDGNAKRISRSSIESEGLLAYLDEGKASETIDRYLVSNRKTWYCVEKQSPAQILAKYMNRTGFLFMRNHAGVRTLNNVHTIEPNEEHSEEVLEALLAYLNSRIVDKHLSKYSHNYQGLQKVEIDQLNEVPILDPKELDQEAQSTLSGLYEELRIARRREKDDEAILDAIDQVLEPHLHWEDDRKT